MKINAIDSISIDINGVEDIKSTLLSSNIFVYRDIVMLYCLNNDVLMYTTNRMPDSITYIKLNYPGVWPERASVKIVDPNTIIVFSQEEYKFTFFDFKGRVISTKYINYHNDSIVAQSYHNQDFNYLSKDSAIVINIEYKDIALYDATSFSEYFSRHCELFIPLDSEAGVYNTFGNWPSNYSSGSYYGDFQRYLCFYPNSNNILISFKANDTLFKYSDYKLVAKYNAPSIYVKRFNPIDLHKISDYSYLFGYSLTNTWYLNVICDEYKNMYYRVVSVGVKDIIKEDGKKINSASDIPQSIIVLDSNFTIVAEIDVDVKRYSTHRIIPTPYGIAIPHQMNISDHYVKYYFVDFDE